jgi:hypothetical protein
MGSTTFSGPVRSGTKKDADANGVDNLGDVVLAQSGKILQTTAVSNPGIVIPAGSEILRIDIIIDKQFDGTGNTVSCGFNPAADNLTDNDTITNNPGYTQLTPNGDLADIKNWVNVGDADVTVYLKNSANGGGAGFLRVLYVQGRNQVLNV